MEVLDFDFDLTNGVKVFAKLKDREITFYCVYCNSFDESFIVAWENKCGLFIPREPRSKSELRILQPGTRLRLHSPVNGYRTYEVRSKGLGEVWVRVDANCPPMITDGINLN